MIGMACSCPQYNLRELNNALIHLIDNPECSFDEIYCAPDFATGGILFNESEVKQSMKSGNGLACKLRSIVTFDTKERCFVVTEIPYGVYTNTICGELEAIIESEENPGIEKFNDLTGSEPLIKIYLTKNANPDKVLRYLYKNSSLQHYYGINFTMLENGRFPKVFTWKEMLEAHIHHEADVYRNCFQYDLRKINTRLHIIEGLLICLASIDEVVATIKASSSALTASQALQTKFLLDAAQAKAVLDMKLSKLAHLEVQKLEDEKTSLLKEADRINLILNNNELFNEELKKGWREVASKFGDARRTKIMDLASSQDEPIEKKQISISFTNKGAIFCNETSTLYSQRRNGVGNKFKLESGEYIVDNLVGSNTDIILFFSSHGNFYHLKMGDFEVGEKQYLSNLLTMLPYEHIISATILSKNSNKKYIAFVTKQGLIKKTELSEYNLKRNVGATAIKLNPDDQIIAALPLTNERVGIASHAGNFIMISTTDIRAIGRVAMGVCGMKLAEGDFVVSARIIPEDTKEIISISTDGLIKRTSISEFRLTGRATKGRRIQKVDSLCDFLPVDSAADVLVTSTSTQIRIKYTEIPELSLGAQGVKALKLSDSSKVIKISNV